MHLRTDSVLETHLNEAAMRALFPCDLGDGIEFVPEVEDLEIEMDCDLEDDADRYSAPYEKIELQLGTGAPPRAAPATRARVGPLDLLALDAFERSPVQDTLPFAPYEPSELADDVSDDLVTVPYAKVAPRQRLLGS